ncbi:MAG: hypothetical protein GC129_05030 [Proteobacteria bacterium]|nr:hypothetical protein [Pseudomonadota bacterium]
MTTMEIERVDVSAYDAERLADYYQRLQAVGLLVIETYNRGGHLESRINQDVNPAYGALPDMRGAILEMVGGVPNGFWTPLGYWNFAGAGYGGGANQAFEEVNQWLELPLLKDVGKSHGGEYGPYYAVMCDLDGMAFAMPDTRQLDVMNRRGAWVNHAQAKAVWDKVRPRRVK